MVTIATWNVNSVKARLPHLLDWLKQSQTDIVLIQECKCETDKFPAMEIEDLGYNLAIHGQKTYNGVAILSKFPLEDIQRGIPDFEDDQARYIEAVISINQQALRVASVYVPNGQSVDSDKFPYKLNFLHHLHQHAQTLLRYEEPLVLGGDYNVAPYELDVFDPKALDGTVCYHPQERALLRTMLHAGLYDAYRLKHPQARHYSWWDYRGGAYQNGEGLRIDHLLMSAQAIDRLSECHIDETTRKWEKPSDHAPVVATVSLT